MESGCTSPFPHRLHKAQRRTWNRSDALKHEPSIRSGEERPPIRFRALAAVARTQHEQIQVPKYLPSVSA
jgi:hypothetical protein